MIAPEPSIGVGKAETLLPEKPQAGIDHLGVIEAPLVGLDLQGGLHRRPCRDGGGHGLHHVGHGEDPGLEHDLVL